LDDKPLGMSGNQYFPSSFCRPRRTSA
jgi:hypothetical protein